MRSIHLKKVLTALKVCLFLCILSTYAQQTPIFSEYNYNPYIINAAYAGLTPNSETTISSAGFANQFEGSPRSFTLSFHTPLRDKKIGLGAGVIRDQIGVTTSTSAFVTYSYKIFFDFKSNRPYWQIYEPNVLSFAITAGIQQYQDNLLELGIVDDINFAQNINATIPTIGASFLFNLPSFYIGLSTPNFLGDTLASDDNLDINSPYYGYLGYRVYSNRFENIMIKPNVLVKYESGAPIQTDINLAVSWNSKFEVGTGYRTNSSINFLAGVYLFKSVRFIYNYNLAMDNTSIGSTHGFALSYRFGEGFSKI